MKKQLQTIRSAIVRCLGVGMIILGPGLTGSDAQTYLSENFDGTWSGTPAAPAGWTQTRIQAINSGSERDWVQNTYTTAWAITGGATPNPSGPVSGNGVLWIDDWNFGGTSLAQTERRIESPAIDLSTASSPYLSFYFFYGETPGRALNVRAVISTDGGATWKTLSNIVSGFTVTANTWNRVYIPIPVAYRTSMVKIGFADVNRWGETSSPFIDNVTVEEYIPTTITSAGNGNWNSSATWVGGVVPTSANHVIIDHDVVVTNATSTTGIIANCQNLTVNPGKILSYGSGTANLLQVFGDVAINGTLNAFNGSSGRVLYVGGDFTIGAGGTATFNTGTTTLHGTLPTAPTSIAAGASGLIFTNAKASSFTNLGTLTSGRINNIIHMGSGDFTYNSPVASVPFTFGLYRGNVNPNANLTLGNPASTSNAGTIVRIAGAFVSAPLFNNTNVTSRNVVYAYSNMVSVAPQTLTTGHEIEQVAGVYTVSGTLAMNTHGNVQLGNPVTVGAGTTGALTMTRGIIISSSVNLLTLHTTIAGSAGTSPSVTNPNPTTHGSYVAGPVRINFPSTGTTSRNFPLGEGTAFNSLTSPSSNVLKTVTLASSTAWAGQTVTASILPAPSGTANSPLTRVMGTRAYRLDLNSGPALPATATVTIIGNNYNFGNSDSLVGNINNLMVAQSTALTGPWQARSASSGTASGFAANSNYSRTTATSAPGPIAPLSTNGEYFAFATTAAQMVFSAGEVVRDTGDLPTGAQTGVRILGIKVTTTGIIPAVLSQLNLSTGSTLNPGNITNAKIWYTGASSTFATTTQFGTTVSPVFGSFAVNGTQNLLTGDNYFWLTYDIASTSNTGDTYGAECLSVVIDGTPQSLTAPPARVRTVVAPVSFVSANATQTFTNSVGTGETNHRIIGVEVQMSSTGSTIPLTSLTISTNGTTSLTDISNLRIWSTGTSPAFATSTQFGSTVATPAASQTITGSVALQPGMNYLWVTYDIVSTAVIGNVVDAECTGLEVNSVPQALMVSAPAGERKIRAGYCGPTYTYGKTDGDLLSDIRILGTTLSNNSGFAQTNPAYTYFSGAPNLTAALVQGGAYTVQVTIGTWGTQGIAAWIDYNDDGVFSPSERIGFTSGTIGTGTGGTPIPANHTATFPIQLTCESQPGTFRLRVRSAYNSNGNAIDPCANYGYGETEDYDVTILVNPLVYQYSTVIQDSSDAAIGKTSAPVLRIPVYGSGCSVGIAEEFRFRTTGSTAPAADIVSARLYRTGNSAVFNTSNLLATVSSPGASFSFLVNDTIIANDTTNYWLAYDISPTATPGNFVDAEVDSMYILNAWRHPVVKNPPGRKEIRQPMTYVSSTVTQNATEPIRVNEVSGEIIGLQIVMSSTGIPVELDSLDITTTGTTTLSDIRNLKVWYTGNNRNFTTDVQFGSTIATPSATQTVTGLLPLTNDTNYLWITYDIPSSATLGNFVDATLPALYIKGAFYAPAVSAPAGNREIKAAYCAATNMGSSLMTNVTFNTLNNSPSPAQGPDYYRLFPRAGSTTTTVSKGVTYNLSITIDNSWEADASVWIDYNDDAIFSPSEWQQIGLNIALSGTATIPVTIPCDAVSGSVRMRVRTRNINSGNGSTDACTAMGSGETHDYVITIADNPVSYIYSAAIQQTAVVAPGTTNQPVLRVPVRVNGCGDALVEAFNFTTGGTTNNSDLTAARLYRTGSSPVFSTANLVATVSNPSGNFSFTVSDTLINNDTTNYWLTYDISSGASFGNFADATFASIDVLGSLRTPVIGNPAGNVEINAPMTYLSSTVSHPVLQKIDTGVVNGVIARLMVITSSSGSSTQATSIDVGTAGTTSLSDIINLKVWYTGHSPVFASTTQFGTTVAVPAATQTITGNQNLLNDTNYFWVTYDIPFTAVISNKVDAEISSITVGGTPRTPSVTSPAGDREIRLPYCMPTYTTGKTDGDLLSDIRILGTTLSNNSGFAQTNPAYTYFSGAPNLTATLVQGGAYTVQVTIGTWGTQGIAAWIDYNDDGVFSPSERIGFTSGTIGTGTGGTPIPANHTATFPIQLTCESQPGTFRLRVRSAYNSNGNAIDPCANYDYGETEDYDVTILVNPLVYQYSTAMQDSAAVNVGSANARVLRIPVYGSGCSVGIAEEFRFRTTGSTAPAADIVSARLYRTGNSAVFNTSNLVATVSSPGASFSFLVNDTIIPNDTTNYWLAYDISPTATPGNFVDAEVDSMYILNAWRHPVVKNPSGRKEIMQPMTYVSSTTTQNVSVVRLNDVNAQVIGLQVVMSSSGLSVNFDSLEITTAGTTSLSDIRNLKVWYTGNNRNFTPATQFGSTIATPGATHTVAGSLVLANDTNYFWITYDIPSTATLGNFVDATLPQIYVDGMAHVPAVTAPAGNREIMAAYCQAQYTNGCGTDAITRVRLKTLDNSSGCTGPLTYYSGVAAPVLEMGSFNTLVINFGTDANQYARAWIDYNNDGDYDDADEDLGWPTAQNAGASGQSTIYFRVPLGLQPGMVRLRIRGGDDVQPLLTQACGASSSTYGEAEEYNVNIVAAAGQSTYVWNQSSPASYNVAGNWTPARTSRNSQDVLVFNSGTSVVVNDVETDLVARIEVSSATTVAFNAPAAVMLNADTINNAGRINTASGNVNLTLSHNPSGGVISHVGLLNGSGTIEGKLARWIDLSSSVYVFPLAVGTNRREALVQYTTAPNAGGKITVTFVPGAPGTNGLPVNEGVLTLSNISDAGIWRAQASDGLAGGTFDAQVTAQNIGGVTNYTGTSLLSRVNAASAWVAAGTHVTTSGSNASMVLLRTGLTAFGEMGIAGDAANPLPVKLLSFNAIREGANGNLYWNTAEEQNNKGFEVQRSFDGKTFEVIGFVDGVNRKNASYRFTDENVFASSVKIVFYRLRQVDLDGSAEYSNIVSVQNTDVQSFTVSAYPVPFSRNVTLNIVSASEGKAGITLLDMQGRVVAERSIDLVNGTNPLLLEEMNSVNSGVYFVKVVLNNESRTVRLVKVN